MRSTSADRLRRAAAIAGLLASIAFGAAPSHARDAAASAPALSVTPALAVDARASAPDAAASSARALAVEAAVKKLRADPQLSGMHKTHQLQWNPDQDEPEKKTRLDDSWVAWLVAFARFINDTSRLLFYGVIAVLAALLLVSARHLIQVRAFRRRAAVAVVSHVRDLDVRPESLPDDVGAAAWALWQSGKVSAALSLLYRGALSRLIHRHAVPISASTTEGECLDLARGRIDAGAHRYLTQVVRAWEANTYGNRTLSDAMGESLCSGFATRFDASPVTDATAASTRPASTPGAVS